MFPKISSEELLRKLSTPNDGKVKMVLETDTDTYNGRWKNE